MIDISNRQWGFLLKKIAQQSNTLDKNRSGIPTIFG